MREGLNHWPFILAAYGLGVGATAALIWHSLTSMHRAEARRDRSRET